MSTLITGYITLEKLKQIVQTVEAKQAKGFGFTAAINDEPNQYGQNISYWAEQTKEQREAKAAKWYFANGKVAWTDGKTPVVPAKEQPTPMQQLDQTMKDMGHKDDGGLPF